MKSILLTRSLEDNKKVIEDVEKSNHNFHYIHYPLIKYETLNFDIEALKDYSNIIITSKYAAKILANYNFRQDIWVVGNKSKQELENKDFRIIYVAKNINDLMTYFPPDLYDQTIYLSSNEITMPPPLRIKRQIIYNVTYPNELLSIEQFKDGIDFILLYSQNSAKILIKLLHQNNLFEYLQSSLVIAISLKVANIVRPFIKNVLYCDNDNPNDVIKLLLKNAKI